MGADNNTRNGYVSDLLAKTKEGEGFDVVRLREEIRKKIEAEDKIFGKFLGLVESLQDIIPEEKQRFHAAIKALSTTSGVSLQNVMESISNQLKELAILEKGVLSALPGFRSELKALGTRSEEIKDEISRLRETIVQLEKEEREILGVVAAREREMKVVEETVSKLFSDIGAEIAGIRGKIEEYTTEKVAPPPTPPPTPPPVSVAPPEPEEKREVVEGAGRIEEPPAPEDTEWVRKCPMCGGKMNFLVKEAMWMCYTCGHEALEKNEPEGAGEPTTASAPAAEPAPPAEPLSAKQPAAQSAPTARPLIVPPSASLQENKLMPLASAPVASPPSEKKPVPKKKPCPVCKKQMSWHEREKSWLCSSCGYRRMVF